MKSSDFLIELAHFLDIAEEKKETASDDVIDAYEQCLTIVNSKELIDAKKALEKAMFSYQGLSGSKE
jgi:hypothetical protein